MRIFHRGKGGTWYIEYRDPVTGREVRESLRTTNKRVAQDMAREKAEQVARRHHRLAERKPWGEAVDAFLKDGAVHKDPVSVAEDRRTLKGGEAHGRWAARPPRFQLPEIVRYVDEVRPEHVEVYVAARKALGRAAVRINRELRTLRAFFNWCTSPGRRWTGDNPARQVRQLPEPRGVAARNMTDEQITALLAAVEGGRLEGLVLLALNHGLRESELIHLRRDGAEPARGILWVRHDSLSGWKVKGGQERPVHLNEVTQGWLIRYLSEPVRELSPYLFPNQSGQPLSRENLVMQMGRVMRKIGVQRGGFHMLRHTWASRQAEAGTPIPVLKAMGGWRDWRSMEKYQHIGDEAQREAAARVVIGLAGGKVVVLRSGKRLAQSARG